MTPMMSPVSACVLVIAVPLAVAVALAVLNLNLIIRVIRFELSWS